MEGLSSGASVIVAQFYGAKRDRDVSLAVHTATALSLVAGILISVFGYLSAARFTILLRTPADVVDGTVLYLHIIFLGMIPNLFYNVGASVLRAVGDSRRPLYYLIISCGANIALDLLLVIRLDMGIRGVAIATVFSQLLSAVLVLSALLRTGDNYRLYPSKIRFDREMLKKMLSIGIPAGIQSSMYVISNIVIQASINSFGTDIMAAWTGSSKADVVIWLVFGAFGVTITTFAGQNYGAGRMDRVRQSVRTALFMTSCAMVVLGFLLYTFGSYLMYLFSVDETVIAYGVRILRYFARFYLTFVCVEIISGALRGMGEVLIPTVLDLLGICALRILWLTLYVPSHHTLDAVMISYPVSWGVTSVLFILYYFFFMRKRFPVHPSQPAR